MSIFYTRPYVFGKCKIFLNEFETTRATVQSMTAVWCALCAICEKDFLSLELEGIV